MSIALSFLRRRQRPIAHAVVGARRYCESPKRGRDAWDDAAFANEWSHGGGVNRTNPNRQMQLHLLGTLAADSCVAHMRSRSGSAPRILDLGVGSGLAARSLLDVLPPQASVVGVDSSLAMLNLLHGHHGHNRLTGLHIGFDELESHRAALLRPGKFACVVAVQSLHEVDDYTKRRALSFARSALAPGGSLYILDRFNFDRASPLHADHASMWHALQTSPIGGMPWSEYVECIGAKEDDAWSGPQQCVQLCREAGFFAECLYMAFNRFLVAARPYYDVEHEAEVRHDFEAWRDAQMDKLGVPPSKPPRGTSK